MIICFMSTPSHFPRKHLLVLKTSSTRLQRNNFTPSKTSSKTKNCYAEDVLKTCLEDLLKILSRQTKYLRGISVYFSRDNKSKCVSNKSVFHKSISDNSNANPKCINQNSINSLFALFWNSSRISILRISISGDWFGVTKLA